jgi:hypothetical protein
MSRRRPFAEPPVAFDIYDVAGRLIHKAVDLAFAANLAILNDYDIEWAIEEYGRCDTDELTIVPAGDPWPGPYVFDADGG